MEIFSVSPNVHLTADLRVRRLQSTAYCLQPGEPFYKPRASDPTLSSDPQFALG